MMKYFTLVLFSFLIIPAFGQYQIINAESKVPVSFARIKLGNEFKGVISDYNGYFYLDSSFQKSDTIVISCIGYEIKKVLVEDLIENRTVELDANTKHLSKVIVTSKKTKYKLKQLGITKKPNKAVDSFYAGSGKNGEEKAIWIPNEYSIQGHLKSINVFISDLGYPDAYFRVHVYACDAFETKPGKELTTSNIVVSAVEGNEWVTVDMTSENLKIGENGCFIGIEWFDSPKSKSYQDTLLHKGYTWQDGDRKDTLYKSIRKGNGVVLGEIYQEYTHSKNKLWAKANNHWQNKGNFLDPLMYTLDTLSPGKPHLRTPENSCQAVLCIHIDVAFPKNKIDLTFEAPKKRKLNKIEKVKQDLFYYPQRNIHELISSLIKAVEHDDMIYVLKYLCVYKDDQLNKLLPQIFDDENESKISADEKEKIITALRELQSKLNAGVLTKVDDKHFELSIDNQVYNFIVDEGLWKINPYSYKIHE